MAKTPLFRALSRALRLANAANQNRVSPEEIAGRLGEASLSRRAFLGASLAGIGAMHAAWGLGLPIADRSGEPEVLIVGAGLAGLTAAYRLAQRGVSCEIYEASSRAGGRVWTKDKFNAEGMHIDLGAELVDTVNTDLINLCQELNVPLGTFAEGDEGMAKDIYFAEGKLRSEEEMINGFRPLAAVMASDIEKISPGGVLTIPTYKNTLGSEAIALDRTSLHEYLYRQSDKVEKFILDIVNNAFIGEYGLETAYQSVLNLLVLINTDTSNGIEFFGQSDEALAILGGSEQLPRALVKAISARVKIQTQHRLIAISDSGSEFKLVFSSPHGTVEKKAARALLTLPFSTLREVEGVFNLALSPAKKQSIQQLGYGTNTKVMLGFKSRFWRQASGTVPANRGEIFGDLHTQEFWETSRLQTGTSGILTAFKGGMNGRNIGCETVGRTLRDLSLIYPQVFSQFDGNSISKNWAEAPFQRGSYTCPMPGQYTTFIGSEGEPELSGRLLFAGEHCSVDFQGFMNGAVETGNLAAQAILSPSHAQVR